MKSKKVSIIIVHYKVKNQLFECIESIYASKPKVNFEIIIVENEVKADYQREIKQNFKNIIYIKSKNNLGYGNGNNLGASRASGKYLFILNPDTKITVNAIDSLYIFLEKNKQAGIVAPILLQDNGKPYDPQGARELTPFNAIFVLSFINKLFPKNPISKKYFLKNWRYDKLLEVEVCPGTAFMIPSVIFKKVNGFDEKFFLYFEENDICNRVRKLGYKIYMNPKAKIVHKLGSSTKQLDNGRKIFLESRFKYFNKHYGMLKALFVELFLRINKISALLILILAAALFLRLYNLSISMPFIGDQGWFYLSARDMLVHGKIPLVGITSSHVWLHQGPLWTYMLSIFLLLFKFNPISGAYLTAFFGMITVYLMYKLGSEMFSVRTGIIAALLYSVSSLIVFFDRMPFDPSTIPFFTLIYLYSVYKWVNGNVKYFPIILFLIAVLYNLELSTFTLFFPLLLIFAYVYFKNNDYVKKLLNKKILLLSLLALFVPMLPIMVYDFSNGFKQTIIFLGWTIYKPFSFLIKHSSTNFLSGINIVFYFILQNIQKILFENNLFIAVLLFILSLFFLIHSVYKSKKYLHNASFLLLFFLSVSLAGILVNQTPSDAYLPITFPFFIFTLALFFDFIFSFKRTKYVGIIILLIVVISNLYSSYKNTFIPELGKRITAVDKIIDLTKGQEYNLLGYGPGSQFTSFTMNYEYLLWWKGHPPSKNNEKLKIILRETPQRIVVNKIYD